MDKETIRIDLQNEYRINVESISKFKNSLFKGVYKDAYQKLNDIIKNSDDKESNASYSIDSYNNTINFVGERGKGKTSVMVSFKNSLELDSISRAESVFFSDQEYSEFKNMKFIGLPVIDPTIFRGEETLVEIILAQMFEMFKNRVEVSNSNTQQNKSELKKPLIKEFQDVFLKIQLLNKKSKEGGDVDALDVLLNLSSSTSIRKSFTKLVDSYLRFFNDSNYLIIALDDLDFKIEHNYLMLEDIRQVLINNKIILLTTFKYDQLFESLNNHFRRQLRVGAEERTKLYLNKIFPKSRCIELNSINVLFENFENIVISKGKKEVFNSSIGNNLDENGNREKLDYLLSSIVDRNFDTSSFSKYESIVREILWNSFKIILPIKSNRGNLLLPNTIRELVEFFRVLDNNEGVHNNLSGYLESIIYDARFKELLLRLRNSPKNYFKLTFISVFKEIIDDREINYDLFDNERLKLLLSATNENNVSLADISSLLLILDKTHHDVEKTKLKDILEFYFSLQANIKNINFYSKELYNGVLNLKTENDWTVVYNNSIYNEESRKLYHYLGNYESLKNYRTENSSPFSQSLNNNFRYAVFTPISFFSNISFEMLIKHMTDNERGNDLFGNIEYIYDPLIIKIFLQNYISNNKNILEIKKILSNKLNDSYVEYDYNNNNSIIRTYYNCTARVFSSINNTLRQYGIPVLDFSFYFKEYTLEWFESNFIRLEEENSDLINQLILLKNRFEIVLFDGKDKFESKTDAAKKAHRKRASLIVKEVSSFIQNNFKIRRDLINEINQIEGTFKEINTLSDLQFYYSNINQVILKTIDYITHE